MQTTSDADGTFKRVIEIWCHATVMQGSTRVQAIAVLTGNGILPGADRGEIWPGVREVGHC
jgi:hypothetical protein